MQLRKVNWDRFQLGGHDSRAKIRFFLKEPRDTRSNDEEVRISNAISKRILLERRNSALFATLPADQQEAILKAMQGKS